MEEKIRTLILKMRVLRIDIEIYNKTGLGDEYTLRLRKELLLDEYRRMKENE